MKDMGRSRTPFSIETRSQSHAENTVKAAEIENKMIEDFSSEMGRIYRLITEKTSDLICMTTFSLTPTYVYVSPSHKSLLGYDSKDLLGKCPFDLIHPDDMKHLYPLLANYVNRSDRECLPRSEKSITEKLLYRIKDNYENWRYLETTGDLLDENLLLFVSRDVTERRKVEEELRDLRDKLIVKLQVRHEDLVKANELLQAEIAQRKRTEEILRRSEERYRTILESIEDGYYEVDRAGDFMFFNDALCKILGYSEEELMGLNNRQYMSEETARAVYKAYNGVYRTGKPNKVFGYELIRKDGNIRIVEVSISLIRNAKGEPEGFRGIARDMTDRRPAMVPSLGRAK
jgi:PAS domain S-box-containing protein